ncbi:MAG: ferredoxin [Spirochaetia bacterium]|nr:ferredoxin [Spirochaetia bacterium]
MKIYTISQQRIKCIGCGACVLNAPNTWVMNDADGKAMLRFGKEKNGWFVGSIDETELSENEKAALECPVKIIHLNG